MRAQTKWVAGALALLALTGGGVVVYDKTRGLRNNNPGNIRHGANWLGMRQQQTDASFVQFASPAYGIRAMARLLRTYMKKYGLNTVRKIIGRWAPPNENDTDSYVNSVAKQLDIAPDDRLVNPDAYLVGQFVRAIIRHENGVQPYSDAVIDSGVQMGWS